MSDSFVMLPPANQTASPHVVHAYFLYDTSSAEKFFMISVPLDGERLRGVPACPSVMQPGKLRGRPWSVLEEAPCAPYGASHALSA